MSDRRTLAVDIGGTGIKFAALDDEGRIVGERARVPTPPKPVQPAAVVGIIEETSATVGPFDRVSVGFPGMVRGGKVLTAPNLGTELWSGFDLQGELTARLKKPVKVMNDADVQGYGAIEGKGVEMVLTLGTGAGTSLFDNGRILPHFELAHHPISGKMTYDQFLGNAALMLKGKKKWSKRVEKTIAVLRTVINFDHLYLGGGNAKKIKFDLPNDITVVPNTDGLTGGIRLWHDVETSTAARPENIVKMAAPARAKPVAKRAAAPRAKAAAKPAAKPAAKEKSKPGPKQPVASSAAGRTIAPSQPRTSAGFRVPPGACDCHVHVFGAAAEFPFVAGRGYTPPPASADDLLELQNALSLSRVVIVQPSVYGADNSCTLDGMRRLGPERARGVAVIDDNTTAAALQDMHAAGIRGVRVNLETSGVADPALSRRNLAAAVKRVAPLGWHVQVYTRLSVVEAVHDDVINSGVPIVFDHFGGAQAAGGINQPGFAALLALVRAGKAYVKVSGHYRSSVKAPAFDDVAPLARALIAANPDRIVWGTDWPHPHHAEPGKKSSELTPSFDIDDGLALAQLPRWAPTAATRHKILVDNPARLYDF
ncbi:MAG TPA: ROK family protein [Stellaceae bacterium]|nr:ROK family protein [Stellaceae bacterium]